VTAPGGEPDSPTDGPRGNRRDVIGTADDDNCSWRTLWSRPGSSSFTDIAGKHNTDDRRCTRPVRRRCCPTTPHCADSDGHGRQHSTVERTVNVSGNLKRNFTLSFTDMTVPVSGIPIR
jgi:hypothetical protein